MPSGENQPVEIGTFSRVNRACLFLYMSSVAGRRERTPLRSRFSAANRVYNDIPMSPETPETPRTSASTTASSPFMDAVRNVKERGERDWKRLFNKFQEQDSEARVRVLLVALLPNINFHISIHSTLREALVA